MTMNETEYKSWIERDVAHLLHPQYTQAAARNAIIFVRGEGSVLSDAQGKEYIDGLSSLWNVAVGHGRKELAEAAAQQMGELAFANGYTGYTNLPAIRAGGEAGAAAATATWTPCSSPTAAPRPTKSPSSWRASTGSSRARWRR